MKKSYSGLVRLMHGFGSRQWRDRPVELTGTKIGILGLGTSGRMVGKGLQFFGSDLYYYSRTRKPESEKEGFQYLALEELLKTVDILCTCLSRNAILLHQLPNVFCVNKPSGSSIQGTKRLSKKVLQNIEDFLFSS
jgi:hypothetical protein